MELIFIVFFMCSATDKPKSNHLQWFVSLGLFLLIFSCLHCCKQIIVNGNWGFQKRKGDVRCAYREGRDGAGVVEGNIAPPANPSQGKMYTLPCQYLANQLAHYGLSLRCQWGNLSLTFRGNNRDLCARKFPLVSICVDSV